MRNYHIETSGVLTALTMDIIVFWHMTPCTLADRYGGTRCLHLRVRNIHNNLADNIEDSNTNCYAKCPVKVIGLHDVQEIHFVCFMKQKLMT
jgi:hypothetical protein